MRSVKEKEVTHKYRILSISKSSVVYLLVILACTLTLFPFFWMVIASLTEEKLTYQYPPTFFPLNPQKSEHKSLGFLHDRVEPMCY